MRFIILSIIILAGAANAQETSSGDIVKEEADTSIGPQMSEKDRILAELSWDPPDSALLAEKEYPADTTADAVVVQKEMVIAPDDFWNSFSISIVEKRRVKIYTDEGLTYAKFKEYYDPDEEITSIEATCYNTDGTSNKVADDAIIDETVIKNMKRDLKVKAKAFALPGAEAGCVIDIFISKRLDHAFVPPIFRFQEDIPVQKARYVFNKPKSSIIRLIYSYIITNEPLLKLKREDGEDSFVCVGTDIPSIEDEPFRLPYRNLVSDFCMVVTGVRFYSEKIDFADTWEHLLDGFKERFERSIDKSKRTRKMIKEFKAQTLDEDQLIKLAFEKVRDGWENAPVRSAIGPRFTADDMVEWEKELGPDDKATLLCAMLNRLDIESEPVWVCSDNSDYTAMPNFPSLAQFDYTLVYIPSKDLYLDPTDNGADVGTLDESLWGRLACRPMADSLFISYTPESDKFASVMTNLNLTLDDDNFIRGTADLTFYNQSAIETRRLFRKKGEKDKVEYINSILFRDIEDAVKSIAIDPDSLHKIEEMKVTCEIEIPDFVDGISPDFELMLYPGPSIGSTEMDYNPPRKYPIYFGGKIFNIYDVHWDFNNSYFPLKTDSLSVKADRGLLSYMMLVDYDKDNNTLAVRRQYKRPQTMFKPNFALGFENFLQSVKKCDLESVVMEKQ